jgi:hypothetical protein
MPEVNSIYTRAQPAINLLERLSADSKWAHRGSGYRGALLRALYLARAVDLSAQDHEGAKIQLQRLVDASFELLEKAAIDLID